ncbi:MAG: restriction endonuclease subunit S [Accumulibacter sp.]|jgi:type I restriction enzyme S subunit
MSTASNRTLPDGWERVRVDGLGEIVGGGTPSRNNVSYWNGAIPWVTPSEITQLPGKYVHSTVERISQAGLAGSAARLLPVNSIVVTTRATLGEAAITAVPLATNQGFKNIIPDASSDPRFTYYAVKTLRREMERLASGTTFLEISKADFERINLMRPLRGEQERVAAILSAFDSAIEQTEAVIAKLKQVRAGLVHDLLTKGINAAGHVRDPTIEAGFQMTKLGTLRLEWEVSSLGLISEKIQDGTHFSPKTTSGPRRYVTSKNVRFGYLDLTDCGYISEAEHRQIYGRCDVRAGDLLLTKDGANTGNAAVNHLDDEFSLLSSVAFVRPRSGVLSAHFLLHYLLSPLGQRRLKDLMSGNAITRLTLEKIRAFEIPVPPFDEQVAIAEKLNAHEALIQQTEGELAKQINLRIGLEDDLIKGRIRISADLELA